MMQALENLALDKRNYSLEKRNTLLHKPVTKGPELRLSAHMYGPEPWLRVQKEQQESNHQVSDDNFIENSLDTRQYDINDEEEFPRNSFLMLHSRSAKSLADLAFINYNFSYKGLVDVRARRKSCARY